MKTVSLLSILTLGMLVSCGEDTAGKRRAPTTLENSNPGLSGTYTETLPGIHRNDGVSPLTIKDFNLMIQKKTLPDGYRLIPSIAAGDDENTMLTVNHNKRPVEICGLGKNVSINDRVKSCAKANGGNAFWSAANGIGGEADWKLVTITSDNKEVWVDTRTRLVWSDVLVDTSNWCAATGNKEEKCLELDDINSVCINLPTLSPLYDMASITWRLPTRNEYLQAEVDGLRAVVAKTTSSKKFWTATLTAGAEGHAWAFDLADGTLSSASFETKLSVRCVGTSLR